MTGPDDIRNADIGVIGLGVMGRNLALNMAGHGFAVAGYAKKPQTIAEFDREARGLRARAVADLKGFVLSLRTPRAVILLVPAGTPVDDAIGSLTPFIDKGDLIIDAGNSHYTDTERRAAALAARGFKFMGIGISGGKEGARRGPSIMAGGNKADYDRVRRIFEASAAKAGGEPCAALLGTGSSGHFVKMVHNGIEYALMQIIAESYDIMKRGLGLGNKDLCRIYADWNETDISSYLVEITSRIFARVDERTGVELIDGILDVAGQKGTGMWASQTAMDLRIPVPSIDAAVAMRALSGTGRQRTPNGRTRTLGGDTGENIELLRKAVYAAMLTSYAQGMATLSAASEDRGYALDPAQVAGVWRQGCIIRSAMLEDIRAAYLRRPHLRNMLTDAELSKKISDRDTALRQTVSAAALAGLPVPALMSALAYNDAYGGGWLPANLIQAQRDYFGAHTYKLHGIEGSFHTDWEENG